MEDPVVMRLEHADAVTSGEGPAFAVKSAPFATDPNLLVVRPPLGVQGRTVIRVVLLAPDGHSGGTVLALSPEAAAALAVKLTEACK